MNKKNLKEILNYIQSASLNDLSGPKGAENHPLYKRAIKMQGGETGATGATGPADSPPPPIVRQHIIDLQQAIKDFVETAVAYKTLKTTSGDLVDPSDKRRDFNDFLAEQFMATADIHGDEYTASPLATSKDSKAPTDIIQLNNVIDGLRRTGSEKSEHLADGVWDMRTNNAVKNVYAFAAALVEAYEGLGGIAPNAQDVFTRSDLESFKSAILKEEDPKKFKVSQDRLNKSAEKLIPIVKKLTKFYKIYVEKILDHPAYKQYINQDTELYNFKSGGENPYKAKPDEEKYIKNPSSFALPLLELKDKSGNLVKLNGKVTLEYLTSTGAIANLLTQYLGYNQSEVSNPRLLKQTVRDILEAVNKFITTYGPQLRPTK